MNTDYIYSRSIIAGCYNIDNRDRLGVDTFPIHLAREITDSLSKDCYIKSRGSTLTITIETLSAGEKVTLDSLVLDHGNNA